ncbi:MAG: carbonic anhydrase [Alphaproteobacteria bacterium]
MKPPKFLIEGYERFRVSDGPAKIKTLARGQAPRVMAIGCSDSRVHPATIFSADPGDVFMVRNVANIVPPFEEGGGYHGTSSALEFAVKSLKIKYILVLGHSSCGGVAASLAQGEDQPIGDFIGPWVELMSEARDKVYQEHQGAPLAELQTHLEKANVRQSLTNLESYPFIREAVKAGELTLLGAWFDIETGEIDWAD